MKQSAVKSNYQFPRQSLFFMAACIIYADIAIIMESPEFSCIIRRRAKMPLKIVRNDITKMDTEVIVNTANEHVTVGTGCDSAVYKVAGYDELLNYRRDNIGEVPEGEVFITPGFNLPVKYIIHAVSPLYIDGNQGEEEKLRSCYSKSLKLAKEKGIHSIAFPLIATGGYGYPREEGLRIAADEINTFLINDDMLVYLVVFSDKDTKLGERIYPDLEEYIDQNYVEEKIEEEYGGFFQGIGKSGAHLDLEAGQAEKWKAERRLRFEASQPPVVRQTLAGGMPLAAMPEESGNKPRKRKELFSGSIFKKPKKSARKSEEMDMVAMDLADELPYPDFEGEHESKLEERIRHLSDTFSQYLMFLIQEKGLKNSDVYKRALVDKKTFSKIKNDENYHPNKITALCLCIGALLNNDEARDLLARAGYALSPCDKTDVIFSYFIEHGIYDMIELDIQLEEHGLPCIIS